MDELRGLGYDMKRQLLNRIETNSPIMFGSPVIKGKKALNMNFRKYKLSDIDKQENDDRKYWMSVSLKEKLEAMHKLWIDYCKLKGLDPHEQRLRRVLKITQLSQS